MLDIVFIWIRDFLSIILIALANLPLTVVYDMINWCLQTGRSIIDCFTSTNQEEETTTEEEQQAEYHNPVEVHGFRQEGREDK